MRGSDVSAETSEHLGLAGMTAAYRKKGGLRYRKKGGERNRKSDPKFADARREICRTKAATPRTNPVHSVHRFAVHSGVPLDTKRTQLYSHELPRRHRGFDRPRIFHL